MLKTAVNLLLSVLLGVALGLLGLRVMEPRFIYYPVRQIGMTPDRLGLPYEDIYLTTADGVRINGWFLAAERGGPTVLFLHGNGGNISFSLEKLSILRQLGADVFIIDYRGYGRSQGEPTERGTYRDADAAYRYLVRQRGVDPRRLVVYGESLGAAVAVDLASRERTGGVVLEGGFTSVVDVGRAVFPFLPVRWLVRDRYDTLSKIGRIRAPLLILHAASDEFLAMDHAHKLLAEAHPPKRLVELRGGHNDAFLVSNDAYRAALRTYFASLSH
jgi:fermentation-respiration switch protein FrsA (DUF1100 family)